MNHLQNRIERLEQRGESGMNLLVVIGEPSAEQQAMIDSGRVRTVVQMPDNGRGDHDRNQNKA